MYTAQARRFERVRRRMESRKGVSGHLGSPEACVVLPTQIRQGLREVARQNGSVERSAGEGSLHQCVEAGHRGGTAQIKGGRTPADITLGGNPPERRHCSFIT